DDAGRQRLVTAEGREVERAVLELRCGELTGLGGRPAAHVEEVGLALRPLRLDRRELAAVVPRDEVVVRRELGNRGERFAGLRTVPAGCVFVGDEVVETSGAERANQGGGRPILRVPGDVAVQGERV